MIQWIDSILDITPIECMNESKKFNFNYFYPFIQVYN